MNKPSLYILSLPFRYEDEINKRNEAENTFVLIKKVCCIHPNQNDREQSLNYNWTQSAIESKL